VIICESLVINLKYYRKKNNLSQETFARKINKYDKTAKLKSEDLVIFDKSYITHFSRIDEKKKTISN